MILYLIPAAYQFLALLAALFRKTPRSVANPASPSVSILKPVRGADTGFEAAIRSNAIQQYPDFEILLGAAHESDPAAAIIHRLAREFPHVRFIPTSTTARNRKVGVLIDLARAAKGQLLLVSDSDIQVPAEYLRRVAAPLQDPAVGLVTCVYRARAETWPGRFEALGVATDFGPSTMLAPFAGVDEFGLGSTLCFRAADLERIGGFAAIADYLADDYQLGRRIHALGLKCVLSEVIVETHLSGESWSAVWRHQVRWARTVRVSRPGGYIGLPVTFATLWAFVAAATGHTWIAAALLGVRMLMAIGAGWFVLGSADVLRCFYLIPPRDLSGVAVWIAGLFGSTVEWGGKTLRLTKDGRIA